MSWRSYAARVRHNPKEAFEAELVVAGLGFGGLVLGGLLATDGVYWTRQATTSTPEPVLANVIAITGIAVIVLGLFLAIANVVIFLLGRWRNRSSRGF